MIGVLLLHGFTGGPHEIEPLTEYLKQNTTWEVDVPTLPGHGLDLALEDANHLDWIETAEQAFLSLREKVDTIYLIGFSMGGMIAAYLAGKYEVDRLILLSPSRKYLNLVKITIEASEVIKDRIIGELEENFTYQLNKHKQGKIPLKAYLEFAKCMNLTKDYLKLIKCPVLVLQGIQDGLVPYQTTHYLDKEIPVDIDVIFYADSKHMICLGDDKEVVVGAVSQYLNRDDLSVMNHPDKTS